MLAYCCGRLSLVRSDSVGGSLPDILSSDWPAFAAIVDHGLTGGGAWPVGHYEGKFSI